jgi:hypothetical protein
MIGWPSSRRYARSGATECSGNVRQQCAAVVLECRDIARVTPDIGDCRVQGVGFLRCVLGDAGQDRIGDLIEVGQVRGRLGAVVPAERNDERAEWGKQSNAHRAVVRGGGGHSRRAGRAELTWGRAGRTAGDVQSCNGQNEQTHAEGRYHTQVEIRLRAGCGGNR